MLNMLYVYGDHAYRNRRSLWEHEHVPPEEAEHFSTFDLFPRYVYRIESGEGHRYTTDPVDVRRYFNRHPDAEVEILRIM